MSDSPRSHLTSAANGLLFVSESEAPFEYVEAPLPAGGVLTAETVAAAFGERAPARESTVAEFFKRHVEDADSEDRVAQQRVARFRTLVTELQAHLHDPFVYCFGDTEKKCYIVGASGDTVAGLRTVSFET